MSEYQRVILYGDSLLLAALGSSLADFPSIEISVQTVSPASSISDFSAAPGSAIIFDLNEVPSQMALSLIEKQPDVLFIGLDSAGEKMILLAGQKAHTMTANRLVQLIGHLVNETGGVNHITAIQPNNESAITTQYTDHQS
jgi:hypothetical protein